MIIRSRAPLRLGFAGGGTDLSPYCDKYTGCVLNATINMYAYCTIEVSNNGKTSFNASDLCAYYEMDMDDLNSLVTEKGVKLLVGVYRGIVRRFLKGKPLSFKMTTYSDASMGSGLGGSSALVVAIVKAFVEWLNLPLGEYDIAKLAWEIERIDLGLAGGKQDQYAATFGGFNFIEFSADNKVVVNPLRIKNWIRCELEDSLLLYFLGKSHDSAEIIKQQISSVSNDEKRLEAMHEVKRTAYVMKESVLTGNFNLFADSLKAAWEAKKRTSDVISNASIQKVYDAFMEAGGRAGKISGAGGGGFFMFYINPADRMRITKVLERFGGTVYTVGFTKDGTMGWTV